MPTPHCDVPAELAQDGRDHVGWAQPTVTLVVMRLDVDRDAIDLHHPVVIRRHLEGQRDSLVAGSGANIPRIAEALDAGGYAKPPVVGVKYFVTSRVFSRCAGQARRTVLAEPAPSLASSLRYR